MSIINQVVKGGGGVTPTGSISITNNGTYDVTDKATAVVNVPTSGPALYREFELDNTGKLVPNKTTTHIMDFTGVTDVDIYLLARAYRENTSISGAVDMSDLITISGTYACNNMFFGCTGITSVDLSSLTEVTGQNSCLMMFKDCTALTSANLSSLSRVLGNSACQYMFQNCGLTSISLPSLTTVTANNGCSSMFRDCTALTSASLPSLATVSGNNAIAFMFADCTSLVSADLSGLTTLTGNGACTSIFDSCTSLTTVYLGGTTAIDFGTRTNQFTGMFSGCSQNIDVYAPAANQAQIEAFSGYPNFGGTGTVTWHWRS